MSDEPPKARGRREPWAGARTSREMWAQRACSADAGKPAMEVQRSRLGACRRMRGRRIATSVMTVLVAVLRGELVGIAFDGGLLKD